MWEGVGGHSFYCNLVIVVIFIMLFIKVQGQGLGIKISLLLQGSEGIRQLTIKGITILYLIRATAMPNFSVLLLENIPVW